MPIWLPPRVAPPSLAAEIAEAIHARGFDAVSPMQAVGWALQTYPGCTYETALRAAQIAFELWTVDWFMRDAG